MTNAELKILQDAAGDKSYKETAADLGTSEARIKNIASGAFRELDVHSKAAAVAVALRRGLID